MRISCPLILILDAESLLANASVHDRERYSSLSEACWLKGELKAILARPMSSLRQRIEILPQQIHQAGFGLLKCSLELAQMASPHISSVRKLSEFTRLKRASPGKTDSVSPPEYLQLLSRHLSLQAEMSQAVRLSRQPSEWVSGSHCERDS